MGCFGSFALKPESIPPCQVLTTRASAPLLLKHLMIKAFRGYSSEFFPGWRTQRREPKRHKLPIKLSQASAKTHIPRLDAGLVGGLQYRGVFRALPPARRLQFRLGLVSGSVTTSEEASTKVSSTKTSSYLLANQYNRHE